MFWFFKKPNYPDFVEAYLALDFKAYKKRPSEEIEYVVLDCETTGLEKRDQLVTVGAVKLKGSRIDLSEVLDQTYDFEQEGEGTVIHEVLHEPVLQQNEVLLKELLAYLGNAVIVGHNISFDVSKINQALQKHFPKLKLKNKVLDTFAIMARKFPHEMEGSVAGAHPFQLDNLCTRYDIPVEERHTALGDAYITAQLFLKIK